MTLLALLMLLLALLGIPIYLLLAGAALWLFHQDGIDAQVVIIEIYRLAKMPSLLALPLLTYAGTLLSRGNGPKRLVNLANALVGKLPAGLALTTLLISAIFSAFTGSSGVTIIALGGLLLPLLKRSGYPGRFSLGLLTTGGSFGLLFPPSMAVILYAIIARVPIADLFRSAFIPGVLLLVLLGAYVVISARGPGVHLSAFQGPSLHSAFREAAWDLPLIPFLLITIYTGMLTLTEAATAAAIWVTWVQVVIKAQVDPFRGLPKVVLQSMELVGALLITLAASQAFTAYLVDIQITDQIFGTMAPWLGGRLSFLLALNVFLLLVGSLLDLYSAVVIVVPLLLPLAAQYQIDPLHLGVIFLANLELGYITPPVGLNLFISSLRFKKPVWAVYGATWPYLLVLMMGVLVITFVPALSLWWRP